VGEDHKSRKNFTMLPNFIFELDLSKEAFRLLAEYIRWENARSKRPPNVIELKHILGCGAHAVQKAKGELLTHKLITIERRKTKGLPDRPIVANLWRRNSIYFKKLNCEPEPTEVQVSGNFENLNPVGMSPEPRQVQHLNPVGSTKEKENSFERNIERETSPEWDHICSRIEEAIGTQFFQQWFPKIEFGGIQDGTLNLRANTATVDWVEHYYRNQILTHGADFGITKVEWR